MEFRDLRQAYPELEPVDDPPRPWHFGPFSCLFAGAGQIDLRTNTYQTTYSFALFRNPCFFLGTYRVIGFAYNPQVLGRASLSVLAQVWNATVLLAPLAIVLLTSFVLYTTSPEYKAGVKMARADALVAAGDIAGGAGLYLEVAQGNTSQHAEAIARLREFLTGPRPENDPRLAMQLVNASLVLRPFGRAPLPNAELFARGQALFERHALKDPDGWLALLTSLGAALPDDATAVPKLRRKLLEQLAALPEPNLDYLTELATLLEKDAEENAPQLEKLLAPHATKLGVRESARMLGQLYERQGKLDEAHAVLLPYVEGRLVNLHAAEKGLHATAESVQARLIDGLRSGHGPQDIISRLNATTGDQQQEILSEYLVSRMRDDGAIVNARESLRKAAEIAPLALDLGLVMLRRGQTMQDPAARKAELERAEKMFLAIGGVAGESEEYQLSLGQVYYWLGKHEEGKKEFDKALARTKRDVKTLLGVATMLRDVGSSSEARPLTEEAYAKATQEEKFLAAQMRSLLAVDLDDKITWLERASPSNYETKASLAACKGERAFQGGDLAGAERLFREAIDTYAKQPPTAAVLNNQALVYFQLYTVTANRQDFQRGVEQFDRAVALKPTDSTVLGNAADAVLAAALQDLTKDQFDPQVVRSVALSELAYLYRDRAGRDALTAKLRAHPGVQKAKDLYLRVALLAPKNTQSYQVLLDLAEWLEDDALLAELAARLERVKLDLADQIGLFRRRVEEGLDPEERQRNVAGVARLEERVAAADESPLPATASISGARFVAGQLAIGMEDPEELGKAVALAEKLEKTNPSQGTAQMLRAALLMRMQTRLRKDVEEYSEFEQKLGGLAGMHALPLAMEQDEKLRARILDDPDFQKSVQVTLGMLKADPQGGRVWDWCLLRYPQPEAAAQVAEVEKSKPSRALARKIDRQLTPWSLGHVFDLSWAAQMTGDDAALKEAELLRADAGL